MTCLSVEVSSADGTRVTFPGRNPCTSVNTAPWRPRSRASARTLQLLRFSVGCLTLLAACVAAPAAAQDVSTMLQKGLPNVPGKAMTSLIVDYLPGAGSRPHRHAGSAFVFAYVLSGAVRSKVGEEPARVYRVGEFWTEPPGAHHQISENASASEPARLLVVFVADQGDVLTVYDR